MKICPRCKIEKPFDLFYRSKYRKDGYQTYCKACRQLWVKQPEQKARLAVYHRTYRHKHPERVRAIHDAYKERTGRDLVKEYHIRTRLETLDAYGGQHCVCCGETELVFLALDHINGGGTAHRKALGRSSHAMYLSLKRQGYPEGYQVLCHNCNWGKHVNGECPHGSRAKSASSPL